MLIREGEFEFGVKDTKNTKQCVSNSHKNGNNNKKIRLDSGKIHLYVRRRTPTLSFKIFGKHLHVEGTSISKVRVGRSVHQVPIIDYEDTFGTGISQSIVVPSPDRSPL